MYIPSSVWTGNREVTELAPWSAAIGGLDFPIPAWGLDSANIVRA